MMSALQSHGITHGCHTSPLSVCLLPPWSAVHHPNVISLRHCFYSRDPPKGSGGGDELYLNLVMDFVPATLHRTLRDHTKAGRLVPTFLVRCYMWQLLRAVNYVHSVGVCHRDIKPQVSMRIANVNATAAALHCRAPAHARAVAVRFFFAPACFLFSESAAQHQDARAASV